MNTEQINLYISIGTAAIVLIIFILVVILVIWYKGLRKSELKNSEMISKMEKGDIELNQKIQQELARIRLDITEQKTAGGDDLVSHVISSLTPTLASYVKSWF